MPARGLPGLVTLRALRRRRVRKRLLVEEDLDETVVDEVHHHWVVFVPSLLEVLVALAVAGLLLVSSPRGGWLLVLVIFALLGHAGWRFMTEFMDVFVVTNMRVFRVSGVLTSKHATTPLSRILDITVDQPFLGLVLGYGHFTFESAAHEQGLRDIRFVSRPLERDKRIQRHVQMSGLRGPSRPPRG